MYNAIGTTSGAAVRLMKKRSAPDTTTPAAKPNRKMECSPANANLRSNEGVEKVPEGSKSALRGGPATPPRGKIVRYTSFYEAIFRVDWEEIARGTFFLHPQRLSSPAPAAGARVALASRVTGAWGDRWSDWLEVTAPPKRSCSARRSPGLPGESSQCAIA